MAKYCPVLKRKVTYLDCQECEEKECKEPHLTGENNERKTSIRNFKDESKNVNNTATKETKEVLEKALIELESYRKLLSSFAIKWYKGKG